MKYKSISFKPKENVLLAKLCQAGREAALRKRYDDVSSVLLYSEPHDSMAVIYNENGDVVGGGSSLVIKKPESTPYSKHNAYRKLIENCLERSLKTVEMNGGWIDPLHQGNDPYLYGSLISHGFASCSLLRGDAVIGFSNLKLISFYEKAGFHYRPEFGSFDGVQGHPFGIVSREDLSKQPCIKSEFDPEGLSHLHAYVSFATSRCYEFSTPIDLQNKPLFTSKQLQESYLPLYMNPRQAFHVRLLQELRKTSDNLIQNEFDYYDEQLAQRKELSLLNHHLSVSQDLSLEDQDWYVYYPWNRNLVRILDPNLQ